MVFDQVSGLLPQYVKGWPHGRLNGAAEALAGVFARYCELIIDRLNQVPRKNLLAFLDLLGVSLAPPQPARVPLTFYLAPQSPMGVVVPALTQAAALPAKGETEPVIFETERELVLSPALLDSLWVLDTSRDRYSRYDDLLDQTPLPPPKLPISDNDFLEHLVLNLTGKKATPEQAADFAADIATDKRARLLDRLVAGGMPMFCGNRPVEHILYLGLFSEFSAAQCRELRLNITLENDLASMPGALQWEIWNGQSGVPLSPASDGTQGLMRSGEIVFTDVLVPPLVILEATKCRWLRLLWTSPDSGIPKVLPVIADIAITVMTAQQGAPVDLAFFNSLALDLSKDFFPLGERPKFGDTLYLSSPVFSGAQVAVTLNVEITNPATGGGHAPVPPVKANAVVLKWEFWDGGHWSDLGTSESEMARLRARPGESVFSDTTQAFTTSGQVTFKFPSAPRPVVVNRQSKCWIRARFVSGDYGRDLRYEQDAVRGTVITPETFAPPLIHSIQVDQSLTMTASPEAVLTYNNFECQAVSRPIQAFRPFETASDSQVYCYLGFLAGARTFPSRSMSIYFGVENSGAAPDDDRPSVIWEYWNGKAWTAWTVRDDTRGLRSSGVIRFLAPPDFSDCAQFGRKKYWLRIRKILEVGFKPMLKRVLMNTTMASQTQTTQGEVLGSGSGKPRQVFRTARAPVLESQQLEVLELSVPSSAEKEVIERAEGINAITEVPATVAMQPAQAWVRWHEIANFEGSGPRDRHYVVDRASGEIKFGDAVNGMAPPALTANIRMARYQTGGGSIGNKPAASIVQLKTAIPYVQRVTNFEAADGGADSEQPDQILERETRRIRHRECAVTAQDFEDLALLASNEVARAWCIPLRDLRSDRMANVLLPGAISLILVPRWTDGATAPARPSAQLIAQVRMYLDGRRHTGGNLVLLGPEYMRIHANVEITVPDANTASDVELAVTRALARYLNPLTGFKGAGWDFGKLPHKSDLYASIEAVPGVEHVRSLKMQAVGDLTDTEHTGRFLVTSGEIHVTATLEK
jgi:hypothetical protein